MRISREPQKASRFLRRHVIMRARRATRILIDVRSCRETRRGVAFRDSFV